MRSTRSRGLSLVETVLALFVLSGVLLAVANLLPSSLASIGRSDQSLRADEIAQSVLAVYANTPFSSLTVDQNVTLGTQESNGITYTPHFLTFAIPNRNVNMLKGLRVSVDWTYRDQSHTTVQELWVSNVTH